MISYVSICLVFVSWACHQRVCLKPSYLTQGPLCVDTGDARLQSRTDPASRYDSPPCETLKHEFCAVQSTTLPRYQPIYQPIPITGLPYLGSPPLNRTLAALCSRYISPGICSRLPSLTDYGVNHIYYVRSLKMCLARLNAKKKNLIGTVHRLAKHGISLGSHFTNTLPSLLPYFAHSPYIRD